MKTPKQTTASRTVFSVRTTDAQRQWVLDEAEKHGGSVNDFFLALLNDAQQWFGLPKMVVDEIEDDRKALGEDRRNYLQRVLMHRYAEVKQKGPGFERRAEGAKGDKR